MMQSKMVKSMYHSVLLWYFCSYFMTASCFCAYDADNNNIQFHAIQVKSNMWKAEFVQNFVAQIVKFTFYCYSVLTMTVILDTLCQTAV